MSGKIIGNKTKNKYKNKNNKKRRLFQVNKLDSEHNGKLSEGFKGRANADGEKFNLRHVWGQNWLALDGLNGEEGGKEELRITV